MFFVVAAGADVASIVVVAIVTATISVGAVDVACTIDHDDVDDGNGGGVAASFVTPSDDGVVPKPDY